MTSSTYSQDLHKIVDRFLHTVVVVDDRAFVDPTPKVEFTKTEEPSVPGGRAVLGDLQVPKETDEHDLDAKKVTDAFARSGLICALLEPTPGAGVDEELLNTARRADLIVIDWVLDRDNGAMALNLIGQILSREADSQERQRLRLIAIYTGQRELHEIAAKIKDVLSNVYADDKLVEYDEGLALTKGPVRIAVFAKENAAELPSDLAQRRVHFSDLPSRLRNEFALLTDGLVTSVALAALAALRDDTHRILKVLHPGLNAAYLGHRSALPTPKDAERHALALVASELRSVIEDHDVSRQVNEDVLARWIVHQQARGLQLGALVVGEDQQITDEQVSAMLRRGLGDEEELAAIQRMGPQSLSKSKWKTIKKNASQVFSRSKSEASFAEAELARLMMLRTMYARPERTLHLGTVIETSENQYLVCVQPMCDSVRLKAEGRSFPFLQVVTSSNGEKSNLVVRGARPGEWKYLLVRTNPRDLVVKHFSPKANHDEIIASEISGEHHFEDSNGERYRWICEMKAEFAQKIAVDLASEFAQVAVDEAEALRLTR
jgi:hypothetical protein